MYNYRHLVNHNNGDKMNIDIRRYIIDNFMNDGIDDINKSIDDSISSHEDDALIGLGVLFELAWTNATKEERYSILNNIKKGMTK